MSFKTIFFFVIGALVCANAAYMTMYHSTHSLSDINPLKVIESFRELHETSTTRILRYKTPTIPEFARDLELATTQLVPQTKYPFDVLTDTVSFNNIETDSSQHVYCEIDGSEKEIHDTINRLIADSTPFLLIFDVNVNSEAGLLFNSNLLFIFVLIIASFYAIFKVIKAISNIQVTTQITTKPKHHLD
ncbi:hypothetical protein PCE1_002995 [Barthelona sp. PCE]